MCRTSMKISFLWMNIEHISVILGNFDLSVYQCAHFYEKNSVLPQILSNSR